MLCFPYLLGGEELHTCWDPEPNTEQSAGMSAETRPMAVASGVKTAEEANIEGMFLDKTPRTA